MVQLVNMGVTVVDLGWCCVVDSVLIIGVTWMIMGSIEYLTACGI